jgi:hypothetical protein
MTEAEVPALAAASSLPMSEAHWWLLIQPF